MRRAGRELDTTSKLETDRLDRMKTREILFGVCMVLSGDLSARSGQTPAPVTHFVNGRWFDGTQFVADDFFAEGAMLTHHPKSIKDIITVDLHGGFVVPPYGDAHEHNFDNVQRTPAVTAQYLKDGIFYAQGMTDTLDGARAVAASSLVNTPSTVDVTYAHGGLTGVNGHPKEVYESLANGFYYPTTDAQRQMVIGSHKRAGQAYWEIDTPADLEEKWPMILATKPDLIKIYLTDSEHYTSDSHTHPVLGKGLDPAFVPMITARTHAAGLKVAAHVDTATDYHIALTGGVDEMGHMPGYYMSVKDDPARFRISDQDVALTAKRHVTVQATAGIDVDERTPEADVTVRRISQIGNLRRLKAAGVTVVVGSDHYGQDALHEATYLQALGVWTNLEMLRMWSVATPRAIFPMRKMGELKTGYEASFLVLSEDPLEHWSATHEIVDRWKMGKRVVLVEDTK
jgi:hypothetical protein